MLTLKQAENAFRSGEPPGEGRGTFESFLRDYEPKLNEIVRKFLGKRAFDPETFMDYKLGCAAVMLERWKNFDASKGIQFSTFVHHDVMNTLLRSRMFEESGSFSSLDEYKAAWRIGALMYGAEQREAVEEFIKKRGCSEATARRFLKIAQLMLNSSSLENDAEASYSWDYVDVLWDSIRAEKVHEAFAKLSYREQTLLEKRNAICMTCGRVAPLSERASFEDLAIEFESSSPRTAERAYRRAVEKLENGMTGFLTQPVLSAQAVVNLKKTRETLGEKAKILAGIMPVVSQRNAIFMENEVNGIHVDAEIIERFAGLDRAQGEELGLEVSVKAAQAAAPYADGFYLMTPFNRIALMERLIARLKDEGIAD